jgi:tetratricopeptide (TPR) repeat protein
MATKLQAARKAQGWSQMRLISELQRQAQKIRMPIAGQASLKTLVSRWENGHAVPDECYQRLLRAVFGAGNAELGFAASSSSIIANLANDQAPNDRGLTPTDPQIVEYLFAVLREHSRADNMIGPQFVLGSVLPQVGYIRELLRNATGKLRVELLQVAARYHEFSGWLWQDAGQPDKAMEATDQALGYAHQTGDPRLMSYVFMRKSNIATDCVNAELGLELAIAALSTSDSFSAHLRAVSLRQQANAYAILGDRDNCARAVDAALDEVAGTAVSPDELAAYCTTPYVEMEAATCWLRLDHPNIAIEIYEQGLSEWPALLRRDRGLCLSRLARAQTSSCSGCDPRMTWGSSLAADVRK